MQVYHVDDSQNWDIILNDFREAILNEQYEMSEDIQELLGKGAVELVGYSLFECVLCKEDNEGNYSDLQMLTKKNLVNHVGGIIKIKSVNNELGIHVS